MADPFLPGKRQTYEEYMRSKLGMNNQMLPVPGGTRIATRPATARQLPAPVDTKGMFTDVPQLPTTMQSTSPHNWRKVDSSPGTAVSNTPTQNGLNKAIGVANAAAPFVSNLVNTFRRPPKPKRGMLNSYTALQKVNLDNERAGVRRTFGAANAATERNVDGNTAEAVKAFNRGQEFGQISSISERESNANVGISNQQAQMDAAVSASNVGSENKYRDETVQREVAHQREQSANLANAMDKVVLVGNERSKERTELAKAKVLADGMYGRSGVLIRERERARKAGDPDPMGIDYADLKMKLSKGGSLRKLY